MHVGERRDHPGSLDSGALHCAPRSTAERPLFESITEAVLKRTASGRGRLAGDGTVLEAMSSRFALIKREALEAQREQAQAPALQARIEQAQAVLAERPEAKAIVVSEPEAGLLKLKNGRGVRPAYQAAVLVNEARVVVDAQVHSTSEQAALASRWVGWTAPRPRKCCSMRASTPTRRLSAH
jgi:hypothetical protein